MGFVVVNGAVHGTGEGKARHVTNDGVMVVSTSTHLLALVANQSLLSQNVVYGRPHVGHLSVGILGILSIVSSQPSPTFLQHQKHQITSMSSNLCHHALVKGGRPR